MVGRPWESLESVEVAKLSAEYGGEKLKREELLELGRMFESRKRDELRWALDDDVEVKEEWLDGEKTRWDPSKRRRSEVEVIRFLVDRFVLQNFLLVFEMIRFLVDRIFFFFFFRLCGTKLGRRDWKLRRIMKQSGLEFTEGQVLRIVEGLGAKGCWKQALSVVEWLYDDNKETRQHKSR